MNTSPLRPETRYAASPEGYVAYQAFGSGPPDLVFMTHWATNVDAMWDEPSLAAYMERLASFARVICYDKRGTGVSDPVPLESLPTIEQWTDDARTVMDAVGVEQAALLGDAEGGPMAAMLAASHPERVSALVLVNSFARWRRAFCMANASDRSHPFAPVRSNELFAGLSVQASERERTRSERRTLPFLPQIRRRRRTRRAFRTRGPRRGGWCRVPQR